MKTLIITGHGAMHHIRCSYARTMSKVGFNCAIWHPDCGTPLFDVFDEYEPEIVFCGTWQISRPLFKNLMKRPNVKVILWGSNWGVFDKEIDTKTDPVLMATDQEKEYVRHLQRNNNIRYILTYYSQKWANVTHNKWRELGLEPVGLPLAADLLLYQPTEPDDKFKCDLSFIGGYWPYKATNLNTFLLPLCYPEKELSVKIFGWGGWPVAQHLGLIDDKHMPILFSSSTVNANVFEPLAQKYGFDVNERCYKLLACNGFCVSEYCESAANDIFVDNEVIFAKTPQEFHERVEYFVRNPDKRQDYVTRGLASVRKKHNYFLRLCDIMRLTEIDNATLVGNLDKEITNL